EELPGKLFFSCEGDAVDQTVELRAVALKERTQRREALVFPDVALCHGGVVELNTELFDLALRALALVGEHELRTVRGERFRDRIRDAPTICDAGDEDGLARKQRHRSFLAGYDVKRAS